MEKLQNMGMGHYVETHVSVKLLILPVSSRPMISTFLVPVVFLFVLSLQVVRSCVSLQLVVAWLWKGWRLLCLIE